MLHLELQERELVLQLDLPELASVHLLDALMVEMVARVELVAQLVVAEFVQRLVAP